MALCVGSSLGAQGSNFALTLSSPTIGEDTTGVMSASLESDSAPIAAFAFALCFDSSQLEFMSLEVDPLGFMAGAGGYDYSAVVMDSTGVGVAVIVDFELVTLLLPGVEHDVAHIRFHALADAGTIVDVTVCDNAVFSPSDTPVNLLVLTEANVEMTLTNVPLGQVSIEAGVTFLRGDFNRNGLIELIDAIQLLTWGFLNGSPPGCLELVDYQRDGSVSVTLEAILLLSYLFLQGDPPAGPFPDCELVTSGMDCDSGSSNCP